MPARSVSWTDKRKWRFVGNVLSAAICLGDADNDNEIELVVGNTSGTAAMFKYADMKEPRISWNGLGTITCIAIGDIKNIGRNSVVITSAEGLLHVFDVTRHVGNENNNTETSWSWISCFLPAPVNIYRILIADIDGDGRNEFVAARTDRNLHAFEVIMANEEQSTTQFLPTYGFLESSALDTVSMHGVRETSLLLERNAMRDRSLERRRRTVTMPLQSFKDIPGGLSSTLQQPITFEIHDGGDILSTGELGMDGAINSKRPYLHEKHSWSFDAQLGTLSLSTDDKGYPLLYIALSGGTFVTINYLGEKISKPSSESGKPADESTTTRISKGVSENYFLKNLNQTMSFVPTHYISSPGVSNSSELSTEFPFDAYRRHQAEVGCDILTASKGEEKANSEDDKLLAVVTSDGNITICDKNGVYAKHSDLRVTTQLFCAAAVPLLRRNSNQSEHELEDMIVACGWDGTTYIVDSNLNAVQVLGEERVCAFQAGMFAMSSGRTAPCLFYVNFEDEIIVSVDVSFQSIPVCTLIEAVTGGQHVSVAHYSPSVQLLPPRLDSYNEETRDASKDFYTRFDGLLQAELGKEWKVWKETRENETLLTRFSSNATLPVPPGLTDLFRRALYDTTWINGYRSEKLELQKRIEAIKLAQQINTPSHPL